MKTFTPCFKPVNVPDSIELSKVEDGWLLNVKKESSLTLTLTKPLDYDLLLLEFQVINEGKQAVVIDINTIRNKLSGKSAPYPNGNSTFHYQLNEDRLDTLQIRLSKGTYRLENIQWHTYEKELLTQKEYSPVVSKIPQGQDILSCQVTTQTQNYFVTSIPYQRGLEIQVNGETVPIIKMNQAFAGAALSPGTHTIKVQFHAPGQKLGFVLTLICWGLYLGGALVASSDQ